MRHERSPALWALFPLLAVLKGSGLSWMRWQALAAYWETLLRLAVWAFFIWSLATRDWSATFWTSLALVGLGMVALWGRWYANRSGWRRRWLKG